MTQTLTTSIRSPSLTFPTNNRPPPFTGKLNLRCHSSCNATVADPAINRSSFYEVLKVKRDATSNEIKAAYRNLAKVYHPDCCDVKQYDDEKFIEIHDAYATLFNPVDRAMYDMKLNMTVGKRRVVYTSRRWETDQCW
ncbi:hypothetical protein QVD17_14003 [Tagetes erecta]|uniref:J domain-containing protein n=1 Tax=Tagetes erecta TaxID=13708 RepID=A0AAD8KYF9_TARER|nr:hypothetical protein QVD17_14003 [Tagetes erecta]